ncbi:MAG: hypothetical protein HZB23_10355 [Deltaproteobacteria bacterium]|nr:hypothetical protein [Deltaproteobacteria bacterium]
MKSIRSITLAIIGIALLLSGCGGAVALKDVMPVPGDRPLYGYTESGVFFIHESVIANAGARSVIFVSEVTRAEGRKMILANGYYTYDVNRVGADRVDFDRQIGRGVSVRYFFIIGTNVQIPRDIMDKTGWIAKADVTTDKGIPVLSTKPVKNPHIQGAPAK